MTSSTLISPSGQGLSSTQKTVDYLFAATPGARVASKERVRRHPLFIAQTVIASGTSPSSMTTRYRAGPPSPKYHSRTVSPRRAPCRTRRSSSRHGRSRYVLTRSQQRRTRFGVAASRPMVISGEGAGAAEDSPSPMLLPPGGVGVLPGSLTASFPTRKRSETSRSRGVRVHRSNLANGVPAHPRRSLILPGRGAG
jgi:hypothetical protein